MDEDARPPVTLLRVSDFRNEDLRESLPQHLLDRTRSLLSANSNRADRSTITAVSPMSDVRSCLNGVGIGSGQKNSSGISTPGSLARRNGEGDFHICRSDENVSFSMYRGSGTNDVDGIHDNKSRIGAMDNESNSEENDGGNADRSTCCDESEPLFVVPLYLQRSILAVISTFPLLRRIELLLPNCKQCNNSNRCNVDCSCRENKHWPVSSIDLVSNHMCNWSTGDAATKEADASVVGSSDADAEATVARATSGSVQLCECVFKNLRDACAYLAPFAIAVEGKGFEIACIHVTLLIRCCSRCNEQIYYRDLEYVPGVSNSGAEVGQRCGGVNRAYNSDVHASFWRKRREIDVGRVRRTDDDSSGANFTTGVRKVDGNNFHGEALDGVDIISSIIRKSAATRSSYEMSPLLRLSVEGVPDPSGPVFVRRIFCLRCEEPASVVVTARGRGIPAAERTIAQVYGASISDAAATVNIVSMLRSAANAAVNDAVGVLLERAVFARHPQRHAVA